MGGASIALPLDAVAAANNPAGIAFVPSSATLGLQVFNGHSSADYVLPGNHLENRQTTAGARRRVQLALDPDVTVGISVSGAGAGSDYGQPALPVPGAGTAKTTLRVAEIIPAVAWKPRDDLALGLGLTLALGAVRSRWRDRAGAGAGRPAAASGSWHADGDRRRRASRRAVEARSRLVARRELQVAHAHGPARRLRPGPAGLQRRPPRRACAVRRRHRVAAAPSG